MYNIHIVKRFRAHCGFYAIENKLLLYRKTFMAFTVKSPTK